MVSWHHTWHLTLYHLEKSLEKEERVYWSDWNLGASLPAGSKHTFTSSFGLWLCATCSLTSQNNICNITTWKVNLLRWRTVFLHLCFVCWGKSNSFRLFTWFRCVCVMSLWRPLTCNSITGYLLIINAALINNRWRRVIRSKVTSLTWRGGGAPPVRGRQGLFSRNRLETELWFRFYLCHLCHPQSHLVMWHHINTCNGVRDHLKASCVFDYQCFFVDVVNNGLTL